MTENDHREEATQSLAVELFELSHEPSSPDDANGMEEARSRAEKILHSLARDAEPTTVTAEQIEAAAIAHYTGDKLDPGRDWRDVPDVYRGHMLAEMERSFRAAGFAIEEAGA